MENIYIEVAYKTVWKKVKKDGTLKKGTYITKTKTPYHDHIHTSCDYAQSGKVFDGPIPMFEVEKTTRNEKYAEWLKNKKKGI